MRPDNLGTTRAALTFTSPPLGYEDLELPDQRAVLRREFAGAGWDMTKAQKLPPSVPRVTLPTSRAGIATIRAAARVAASAQATSIARRFNRSRSERPARLPDYDFPAVGGRT